ncbi:hypothetical protein H920_03164 [Fukomys damarensis]|uniref:Uncharacterized protein n=1 Tax=Fukomys damarensis TaxID=885580 RepID=A0A091EIV5_FUKDA|nr:hypothetical protein H920_03164 [Fukomys damarensis]
MVWHHPVSRDNTCPTSLQPEQSPKLPSVLTSPLADDIKLDLDEGAGVDKGSISRKAFLEMEVTSILVLELQFKEAEWEKTAAVQVLLALDEQRVGGSRPLPG